MTYRTIVYDFSFVEQKYEVKFRKEVKNEVFIFDEVGEGVNKDTT